MKILLLGEYSNVHHTLRDALRRQGHEVLLISDGDGWKDYPRDIDLSRRQEGPLGSVRYLCRLFSLLPRMRGYDVVQIINPDLLHLKPRWNRWFFRFLRWSNRLVSVGCFGDDYYVIQRSQKEYVEMRKRAAETKGLPPYLEYTDFYAKGQVIDHPLNRQRLQGWVQSAKAPLTQYIMSKADCLIACLYEYYKVYDTEEFRGRLHYVPLPIDLTSVGDAPSAETDRAEKPLKILLAVQKRRAPMKGTDQMEPLFQRLAQEHPEQITLKRIESVPFDEYCQLLDEADVIVDQLYSYTPAMNALEAMSRGKIVVSGGEEDYYRFQEARSAGFSAEEALCTNPSGGEVLDQRPSSHSRADRVEDAATAPLRPVINLRPFEPEQNYQLLTDALLDSSQVAKLKQDSLRFVRKYHNADVVAAHYLYIWQKILK